MFRTITCPRRLLRASCPPPSVGPCIAGICRRFATGYNVSPGVARRPRDWDSDDAGAPLYQPTFQVRSKPAASTTASRTILRRFRNDGKPKGAYHLSSNRSGGVRTPGIHARPPVVTLLLCSLVDTLAGSGVECQLAC
jgi:hypothetical protein